MSYYFILLLLKCESDSEYLVVCLPGKNYWLLSKYVVSSVINIAIEQGVC